MECHRIWKIMDEMTKSKVGLQLFKSVLQNTTNNLKLFEMYDRDIYHYCIVKCTSQSNNNTNVQY